MESPKYPGRLGKPRRQQLPGLLTTEEAAEEWCAKQVALEFAMLQDLCDYFLIPRGPDQWLCLSLALAREHVPGFRPAIPRGRKKKWGPFERMVLLLDMLRELPKCGNNADTAAYRLCKREPWRTLLGDDVSGKGGGSERLRTEYFSAKSGPDGRVALDWLNATKHEVANGTTLDGGPAYASLDEAIDAELAKIAPLRD